jgi:hypothetical protein
MSFINQIKEKVTQYVDVRVKLVKLTVISRTSGLLSYFMYALIALFVLFCVLLFSGFSLVDGLVAMGLSHLASTLIVLGIYVLMLGLLVGLRKSIIRGFSGIFIRILTEADNEDDDDDEEEEKKERK